MHKHCEENALTGMIEEPRPDHGHRDDQTRIGCERREIKGAFENRSGNEVNRQVPQSMQDAKDQGSD